MRAFKALMIGAVLAMGLSAPAAAHGPDDGRIPGKPDVHKVGKSVHVYDEDTGNYILKRPGRPDVTAHVDKQEELHGDEKSGPTMSAAPGPGVTLAPYQEAVWCTNSGNRIVPVWAHAPGVGDPNSPQVIRQNIQKMNWKFMQQSSLSSNGSRVLRMVVDCALPSETITLKEFHTTSTDPLVVSAQVEAQFGVPTGAQAVKYLIFFTHCGNVSYGGGFTGPSSDPSYSTKSASNKNRNNTTSAIITGDHNCPVYPSWSRHVTIHELLHSMGATQRPTGDPAPFATNGAHCSDGIDVLCYEDSSGPSWYGETRCTEAAGYYTPDNVPIDCGYDTYFDAAPEPGEWLDRYWNVGGPENPFLSTTQPRVWVQAGPTFQAANVTGDGRAEILGRDWMTDDVRYASPANSFQGASLGTTWSGGYAPVYVADVTGDGNADVLGRAASGDVQVGQGNGVGFGGSSSWGNWPSANTMALGDVNADGRADLVGRDGSGNLRVGRSTGSAFQAASTWGSWSSANGTVKVADVNGDGRGDVVGVSATGDVRVALSTGSAFSAPTIWASVAAGGDVLLGDVSGDGKHDLVTISGGAVALHDSTGSSFGAAQAQFAGWGSYLPTTLADVNGDLRADLVARHTSNGDVRVALAKDDGQLAAGTSWVTWALSYSIDVADVDNDGRGDLVGRGPSGDVLVSRPAGLGALVTPGTWDGNYAPFRTADVTGDGTQDLVGRNASTADIGVKRVMGTYLTAQASWNWWSGDYTPWRLGDVDGDGKADIVGRRTGGANDVQVGLSTGSVFAGSVPWTTWGDDWAPFELADVDGDGRADLIGRGATSGGVAVGLSNGTSFGGSTIWASWAASWGPIRVADVNGDGRGDLVSRSSDGLVRVAVSTGSTFHSVQVWTTWGGAYADFQLADMNGDGRADIIGRNATSGDLQVALSNGVKFRSSASWGHWADAVASS